MSESPAPRFPEAEPYFVGDERTNRERMLAGDWYVADDPDNARIAAHARKAEDPDVEIPVPDGDFPVRKRYPDEVRPAQIEVAKLLYGIHGIERADIEGRNRVNRRNVTAFDAPVMGFVFVHEDMLPWSAMDAGLMLQTLFLSAKSRGIDSCPVGILATWREPVEAEFEIPEGYRFITGFALGYADPDAPINAMQVPRPPIQLLEGK